MILKHVGRIDVETGQVTNTGRLFLDLNQVGFVDLSAVRLLRCSVDTVRQLYRGTIRPGILELFDKPGAIVQFAGYHWHTGRVSRDSGYQFKLQNADAGLVLLVKNFNTREDAHGSHLKIEVSPHLIDALSPGELQARLDDLAQQTLAGMQTNQCAVHLALDVQGWQPPADLVAKMHCRSRRIREISGIDSLDWSAKSSVYGAGETFMFGSPGSVQCAIYNKTLQARATDKLDFWESVWHRQDSPFDADDPANYDPTQTVWRIEFRFHHSVIDQFSLGSCRTDTGQMIESRTFADIAPHLDGLWRYALHQFKYCCRPGYFDPFWTVLFDEVTVDTPCSSLIDQTDYRRYYKTSRGFTGKNVDLFVGNFISLLAREKVGAKKALDALKEWDCWPVIRDHYADRGMTERDFYCLLRDKLQERHVRWGRAI